MKDDDAAALSHNKQDRRQQRFWKKASVQARLVLNAKATQSHLKHTQLSPPYTPHRVLPIRRRESPVLQRFPSRTRAAYYSTPPRHTIIMTKILVLLLALVLLSLSHAFVVPACRSRTTSRRLGPLRAAADGEDGPKPEKRELDRLFEEAEKANQNSAFKDAVKTTVDRLPLPSFGGPKVVSPEPDRPFRFPAYGFLFLSMMLGISFTGSLAELAGGKPLLGMIGTTAVVATAGPGFIASFVVAVKRYKEEEKEDNARLEEEERQEAQARRRALQGPVPLETLKKKE